MRMKAYLPYTLPVIIDVPEGASPEEIEWAAYTEANRLMKEDPQAVCDEMFSEADVTEDDFEIWEEDEE